MDELREYVRTRSQEAFAAIVERYVNLVYAAAVRHVSDRALAEDVTQQVFTLLAQRAGKVSPERPLSAWLLSATRYISINERKLRDNRIQREQTVAAMRERELSRQCAHSSEAPDYAALGPMVDEGLSQLRKGDRDALMLRFFECRSMRDVGVSMGISEEAATKRVRRAVDRLRTFFLRRGVTNANAISAIAILTGAGGAAAPETLREAIVTSVAAKVSAGTSLAGGLATGATIMSAGKFAGLAATIVACGVGVAVYTQVATSAPPPAAKAPATRPATQAPGATTLPWPNEAEQQTIMAVRNECFPPDVCQYLLGNVMANEVVHKATGGRLMTQANSIDRNGTPWLGLVLMIDRIGDKTLRLGNTDAAGPAGIITDTNALFPVTRTQRNPRGPGKYRVTANIDEPWEMGERKQFLWVMGGLRPPKVMTDGSCAMRIGNFPGVDCTQQLVLVLPKGWKLRSASEPAVAEQTLGDFSISFWRKEVKADESYNVDVTLERVK